MKRSNFAIGERMSGLNSSWPQLIYGLLLIALGILIALTALIIQDIEVLYLVLSGFIFIGILSFSLIYTARHIRNIGAKLAFLIYISSNFVFVVVPLIYVVFTRRVEEVGAEATIQEWTVGILMQSVFLLCWIVGFVKIGNNSFLKSIASNIAFKTNNPILEKSVVFALMLSSVISTAYNYFAGALIYGGVDEMLVFSRDVANITLAGFFSSFFWATSAEVAFGRNPYLNVFRFVTRMVGLSLFFGGYAILLVLRAQRFILVWPIVIIWCMRMIRARKAGLTELIRLIFPIVRLIFVGMPILTTYRQKLWVYRGRN
ncbi:MAG: hypothetical protein DRG83_15915, partial [Deltaproteobacteria bacterium]